MNRTRLGLIALAAVTAFPTSAPADAPRPEAGQVRKADLELAVVGGSRIARVRLEVADGATPVRALWDGLFTELFRAADRNGDGSLNPAEAERLPGSFALRQGPPYLNPGYPPSWTELDGDHDGKVGCVRGVRVINRFCGIAPFARVESVFNVGLRHAIACTPWSGALGANELTPHYSR